MGWFAFLKKPVTQFFVFNFCMLLAARLVNGVVSTKNNFSKKLKKRKFENTLFFSSKGRKLKARNNSPFKFAYPNNPFELKKSNVSSFLSAVSEVAERFPLPLFGLSSHQIEEESIFGVSSYPIR